jgi:hypothetical protein
MVEFLLELLLEVLFGGVGEALVEGLARALGAPFGRTDRRHPVAAGIGLVLLGAGLGGLSVAIWPHRFLGEGPLPGVSLIVSPLANGLAWEAIGRWRHRRDRPRTYLSTFWGAALFAFSVAAVRFWLLPALPPLSSLPLER